MSRLETVTDYGADFSLTHWRRLGTIGSMSKTRFQSIGWSPELAETLQELLHTGPLEVAGLAIKLARLEGIHGEDVYSEWLYLLCRLRFTPEEAQGHWRQILEHQDRMGKRLGVTVDLRVALIHYFLEIFPRLESPIVIEMNLFEEARESAYRDELTGLRNYRFFKENLAHEVQRSDYANQPMSLVMMDVDDFKIYNDRNGHQQGNDALTAIARILEASLRQIDGVARFGGEEFTLILPATSKIGARKVAERLRQGLAAHPFPGREHQPAECLTASFGVATYPADARSTEELVRSADRALYVAKSRGKNLVELYADNRRSFRRLEATLRGSFKSLTREHSFTTVDLSTGGIRFQTDCELSIGALLEVRVQLPGETNEIAMAVRVVSATHLADDLFEFAARTLEIERQALGVLVSYLRELEPDGSDCED